jgi:Uncharacterized alpha/beta hydrolase domain (DUF2235)
MADDSSLLSDVGGGNVKDSKRHALSNIPLRWMIREIFEAGCDIFDPAALKQSHIPLETVKRPSTMREASNSTCVGDALPEKAILEEVEYLYAPGRESVTCASCGKSAEGAPSLSADESLDAKDAVKKIRDTLKKNVLWWILEIIPTYYKSQNEDGQWVGKLR